MGALEEVKGMQRQGLSEEQIIKSLRERNIPYKDISEALAQSKIRAAIQDNEVPSPQGYEQYPQQPSQEQQYPQQYSNDQMQQSLMSSQEQYPSQQYTQEQQYPQYAQQPQTNTQQYPDYQQYQDSGLSTDTITEISEQIVSSKMSEIRKQLEKNLDVKTMFEAKMESIDERLKRIEKIIDTLQSSVLRKVGDYVTNVEDIKKELVETQKTFSKIVDRKK